MSESPASLSNKAPLPPDGERFLPSMRGAIRWEHLHRYAIAADLVAGAAVLDIASGEGYGSRMLAARAREVIGVDKSLQCVRHAQNTYRIANLSFIQGDLDAIPLPNGLMDVVVSFESIEHIPTPSCALDEMRRVLRPNGLLIVSTPDKRYFPAGNQFHLGEVDCAEFETLLRTRFRNVRIFGQRVVAGSMLMPLDGKEGGRFGVRTQSADISDFGTIIDAMYLVGVCSDGDLPDVAYGLMEGVAESAEAWRILTNDFPLAEKKLAWWNRFKEGFWGRLFKPLRWAWIRWQIRD